MSAPGEGRVQSAGMTQPCPVRSEPWDDSATMPCQKPEGHDGSHSYTVEWDDDGEWTSGMDDDA